MDLTLSILISAWLPLFVGCATGHAASECPEARQPVAASPQASAPLMSSASVQPLATAPAPALVASASPAEARPAVASNAAFAQTAPSVGHTGSALPELKVHLSGMHIGGGPNDDVSKRPFIQAIEATYDSLRACYKKAEDPTQSGTYGVDLKIAARGGAPELQQVRTALKGDSLRECFGTVFKGIEFAPPPKGRTIVSVSVRFTMGS
jgi:hypothetical protein